MGFQDDNISAEIHDADILPMSAGSCRRGSADSPLPNGARFFRGYDTVDGGRNPAIISWDL